MLITDTPKPGHFCWLDLAATDAMQAKQFYVQVFGWQAHDQAANGGHFKRSYRDGHDAGSLCQRPRQSIEGHVLSHWTEGRQAHRAGERGTHLRRVPIVQTNCSGSVRRSGFRFPRLRAYGGAAIPMREG
jgi:hypothetical protein